MLKNLSDKGFQDQSGIHAVTPSVTDNLSYVIVSKHEGKGVCEMSGGFKYIHHKYLNEESLTSLHWGKTVK